MTTINCPSPSFMQCVCWYYRSNDEMRLFIFNIAGVCAGFPALVWVLNLLYYHHKNRNRISFFAMFLLLSDLLEMIYNPFAVTYITNGNDTACMVYSRLLVGARLCGHLLHQLVALESILTQKYPRLAVTFYQSYTVTLCIFVWLVSVGSQFITSPISYQINIFLFVLPVMLCPVTSLLTCKAIPDKNQASDRNPGMLVLSVALFTLIVLYVPFFLNFYVETILMLKILQLNRK